MEDNWQEVKKSEKVTVNLGLMELAQIDFLADNMLYTSRSDFIRIAVKKQLESHKEDLERLYKQNKSFDSSLDLSTFIGIGVIGLTVADLERIMSENKKYKLIVLGLLVVKRSVPLELADEAIHSLRLYGKIQALPEMKALLDRKMKM